MTPFKSLPSTFTTAYISSMSDLAFDNYCVTCDQLCSPQSIYCSDTCKHTDESQASSMLTPPDQYLGLVSPLLTPSIYHNNDYTSAQSNSLSQYLTDSPMVLSRQPSLDLDYNSLDLNALDSTNLINLTSTSNNYRKWLTACL